MADRPSGSGTRVILALVLLLLAAIGLVVWMAMRPEPVAPATPRPASKPAVAKPVEQHAPRPRVDEPVVAMPPPPAPPQTGPAAAGVEERDTVNLVVEVFGVNGVRVQGATVLLLDPFALHVAGPGRIEFARATTDESGNATFETVRRTMRVYAWLGAEAGSSDKFASASKSHVTVRLSGAIVAKGRVVEAAGRRPVEGATVRFLARPWMGDAFGLALETKSAADGTFELPPIPASPLESVAAGDASIEARAKGWPTGRVVVDADTLRAGEVVVTLERGGFLRGHLVLPTGQSVAGEEVRLADGRSVVASEADGRFELPLPRDGGFVVARRGPTSAYQYGAGAGAAKLVGRFRGDAGDVDLGDVTIPPGQPVRGQVVYATNDPVKAGDVTLSLAGIQVAATQTDDSGRFELPLVGDDPHVLSVLEAPGENAWSGRRRATVDGVRGGATDLRIVLTGALSVLVKFAAEADRSPVVVPEVTLKAVATGGTPAQFGWTWAGTRIDMVRFEVEHAGTYDITVELPGYEPATAHAVEISAEREVSIDVLFRKKP